MIVRKCINCKKEKIRIAYWDNELESYIYLSDESICNKCRQLDSKNENKGIDMNFVMKNKQEGIESHLMEQRMKKILLVEDELILNNMMKEFLVQENYYVDVAFNVSEALAKIENDYDLLILDIELPDGTGIAVAKRFREVAKHQKNVMIAVTSLSGTEIEKQCLEAGMNEFYTKPMSAKKIQEITKRIFKEKNINR